MSYIADKLRLILAGKTIKTVEAHGYDVRIETCDGSAIRIGASRQGMYLSEAIVSGERYSSLRLLFSDFDEFVQKLGWPDYLRATAEVIDNILYVKLGDLKTFEADISKMNEYDQRVCRHPEAYMLLNYACELVLNAGNAGHAFLRYDYLSGKINEYCPEELALTEDEMCEFMKEQY